jgi:glucose/arabinose dehydrogenase
VKHLRSVPFSASFFIAAAVWLQAAKTDNWTILNGEAAWADTDNHRPGQARRITAGGLPAPGRSVRGKHKQAPRQTGTAPNGDIVFSQHGRSGFVAVGSATNVDDPEKNPAERNRANILEHTPEGQFVGIFASGIRNPVGLAIHPSTGELWTSINQRDELGDNLALDYVTRVKRGAFYGWPWYYIGGHPDPRHPGAQFPAEYRNDAFAAHHGSWNREKKAGDQVIRIPLENGKSDGVYQDFLTGFLDADANPWGRPSGVTTAPDGSLLVTDDGANIIWRVSYGGGKAAKGKAKAK